jgi:hypothetical protein
MTEQTSAPSEYWQGVIARLGVVGTEGAAVLDAPPPGEGVRTVTALPLPLYCLLPDRPAVGMAPGGPELRVVGEIEAVAVQGDALWARGRFFLHAEDGRDGARDLAEGRKTLAAVQIRPDETEVRHPEGTAVTAYRRWVLLAAMLTDAAMFPDCVVTPAPGPAMAGQPR